MNAAISTRTTGYLAFRLFRAAVISVVALGVGIIIAFGVFVLFLMLVSYGSDYLETKLAEQDIVLVFANVPVVGLIAAVAFAVAMFRNAASASVTRAMQWLLGIGAATVAFFLAYVFWTRESDPYTLQTVTYLLGAAIPSFVAVFAQWAFARFFFWASGLEHL